MNQCVEVTVIMKDEERTMKQKFLCFDPLINQTMVEQYIKEAKVNFPGNPESVVVKTSMVIQ